MAVRVFRDNCVGLRKGSEIFVFFYDDTDSDAVVAAIARFATNPELNFEWSDAAELIRNVRDRGSAESRNRF